MSISQRSQMIVGILGVLTCFACTPKPTYKVTEAFEIESLVKNSIKVRIKYSVSYKDGERIDSTRERILIEYFNRKGYRTYKIGDTVEGRCWRMIYHYSSDGKLLKE